MAIHNSIGNSQSEDGPERGVSLKLARKRYQSISDVAYDLYMELVSEGPIQSMIQIEFKWQKSPDPVVLDFSADPRLVKAITCNGKSIPIVAKTGHLIIDAKYLRAEKNRIVIQFVAGEQSLNRNDKFLYTLLVPDRASTVFPCFDQPDMKAKFGLKLTLPENWKASANGRLLKSEVRSGKIHQSYAKTKPISTYLFAFAAGEFESITRTIDGRTMTLFHRETDTKKVDRNLDAIFKIHAFSLEWLEEYTDIEYPFEKFDFVLIPSFQYGGMEHVGNIFYNANSLFLDESATTNQKLNRASLIAHETAHMWFGDLVTMKWFDDVWLKEVFANFMAAKIVHPTFPEINHDLGFLLKHHPSAYGEDRTRGTYPIQQRLENLKNAGTLYGRIIYMKAPVVMRQLETLIGPKELRAGLREYLKQYSYKNAVWDDLIAILDRRTDVDLKGWSDTWVKEPGTPEVETKTSGKSLTLKQLRQTGKNRYWSQQIDIKLVSGGKTTKTVRTFLDGQQTTIEIPDLSTDYDFFLANGSELGYGYFRLDEKSKNYLLEHAHEIEDDVTRGAAWIALYESMIRGDTEPELFLQILKKGIRTELEPLNRQNLLTQLANLYWKFLDEASRQSTAEEIESILWHWIESDIEKDAKSAYYKSLVNLALTKPTINRLYTIWENAESGFGLPLSESDLMKLSQEIAIRLPSKAEKILDQQLKRLNNEDRKKRFQFVAPAIHPDPAERDSFFERLKQVENRRPERWALEGLEYLHHPLRANESQKYIRPSLEMLEEIQKTGDIFFPKRWLVATLGGHRSPQAAQIVSDFLGENPDYPYRLRNKILQAADLLFRVAAREK